MTNWNSPISSGEHKLVLRLILFGFALRVVNLATAIWVEEPKTASDGTRISFGIYSIFDIEEMMSPVYSFIVFLICLVLLWRITFARVVSSAFFLLLLAVFFDWWLVDSQRRIALAMQATNPSENFDYNALLLGASPSDVITLFLVNILLVWTVVSAVRLFQFEGDPTVGGLPTSSQ